MKTIARLLFLVAFVCFTAGCDKQNDLYFDNSDDLQLKSADSRTINFEMTGDYMVPIYCDGELVDYLEATDGDPAVENLYAHATAHMVGGKFVWCIVHAKGTFTSQGTGETFKINETDKLTFNEDEEMTFIWSRTHAKGDQGTHVIMFFNVDLLAQTFDLVKGVCPQYDGE